MYPHTWFDAPEGWWDPSDVVRWRGRGPGKITLVCQQRSCEATEESAARAKIDRFDFGPSIHSIASSAISAKSGANAKGERFRKE
jgi:hypothetical protein